VLGLLVGGAVLSNAFHLAAQANPIPMAATA